MKNAIVLVVAALAAMHLSGCGAAKSDTADTAAADTAAR